MRQHCGSPTFIGIAVYAADKTLKRFMVSLDAEDYAALRALAEAQRPPLPLQCLVRQAIRRFPDQPEGVLLKPTGDTSR